MYFVTVSTMPNILDLSSVESIPLREWDGFVPEGWEAQLVHCDEWEEPYMILYWVCKEAA